jgi:serpin B
MHRLLPVLALAACSNATHRTVDVTPDVEAVVAGNNAFAFELDDAFAAMPGNQIWSPLSVSAALGMTYAGAAGQTHDELADLLHVTIPDDDWHPAFGEVLNDLDTSRADPYDLHPADRVWVQSGLPLEAAFADRMADDWDAPVGEADFAADPEAERGHINDWIADATHHHLEDVLAPGTIDGSTRMVLGNAVYFQGRWEEGFKTSDTRPEAFRKLDGSTVDADTMHIFDTEFDYAELDGLKAIRLPYKGGDVSMIVLLPTADDGLPALEASLDADALDAAIDAMHPTEVQLALPKFEVHTSRRLDADLAVTAPSITCESGSADFSAMTSAADLCVGLVQHDAWIQVDEEGTTAAAVTIVMMQEDAMVFVPEFTADHPFLYVIRDDVTGSVLFLGKIEDPTG